MRSTPLLLLLCLACGAPSSPDPARTAGAPVVQLPPGEVLVDIRTPAGKMGSVDPRDVMILGRCEARREYILRNFLGEPVLVVRY